MNLAPRGMHGAVALAASAMLAALNWFAAAAQAELTVIENAEDRPGLTVFKLTVTPAPEPTPAFKHRLIPAESEMRSGNAALHYGRAFAENSLSSAWKALEKDYGFDEVHGSDQVKGWYDVERPLHDLPLDKVRQAASRFDTIVKQCVARGAVRRECDWGRDLDELRGADVFSLLIPEAQETRSLSRALMLRTRVALAEGNYPRAIEHLRMNYRLGQHVASDPILVCGLVGIAEASMGNAELIELISAKDSPNMYWALAELPRPFIDLHPAVRYELNWGQRIFPFMLNAETEEHSPEEWARLLAEGFMLMDQVVGNGMAPKEELARLGVVGLGIVAYPEAKQRLLAGGMDPAQVERMPVGQVMAVDASREYERIANELEKSSHVPYRQAKQRTAAVDALLGRSKFQGGIGRVLASALMPALDAVRYAQMRLDWQLNALQTIEAIRMHAANTGGLPASLEEVIIVPVPHNPVTEKSYEYRRDGDTAVLELPFSDGFPNVAWRFEIKLAK
jgi:hypothetical protein